MRYVFMHTRAARYVHGSLAAGRHVQELHGTGRPARSPARRKWRCGATARSLCISGMGDTLCQRATLELYTPASGQALPQPASRHTHLRGHEHTTDSTATRRGNTYSRLPVASVASGRSAVLPHAVLQIDEGIAGITNTRSLRVLRHGAWLGVHTFF
jgi:hypothetical protein